MFIKKIGFLVISLILIFGTFSVSGASFNYADNNRYQPTIVLSGDLDSNSFFMAGWGSRLKNAVKKIAKKTKDIFVEEPIKQVEKVVEKSIDNIQDSIEIGKDAAAGDFGELKDDVKKDIKEEGTDLKDGIEEPINDAKKDVDDVKDILKDDSKKGSGKKDLNGDSGDNGDLNDDSGSGSGPGSGSGNVPNLNPNLDNGGSSDEETSSVDQPAEDQDNPLTNPFEDLEKKMKDVKAQILNSFSSFGDSKQERISKLAVLVGEKRASDIDLGIQNIAGKFSNLLSRIIDFNSNITRGSKDFFANNPNPATEKDVVFKLRFAFEQIKNSNSLINHLREVYLDIIKAESEKDLQIRYEKNLKPLFIQTSNSIKDTYFYIEKIAKMMREISKNK